MLSDVSVGVLSKVGIYMLLLVTIIGPSKSQVGCLKLLKLLFHIVGELGFEYVSLITSPSCNINVVEVGEVSPPWEGLLYVAVTVSSTSERFSGKVKYEFP